jgi:hypothetical protein
MKESSEDLRLCRQTQYIKPSARISIWDAARVFDVLNWHGQISPSTTFQFGRKTPFKKLGKLKNLSLNLRSEIPLFFSRNV